VDDDETNFTLSIKTFFNSMFALFEMYSLNWRRLSRARESHVRVRQHKADDVHYGFTFPVERVHLEECKHRVEESLDRKREIGLIIVHKRRRKQGK
jgi:hypothetical protein